MTRVIAFINFKGGVGKTANVVNIAAALAKYHNRKVLIVDLDAQSNASLWLMHPEHWRAWTQDLSRTVYQIFNDHIVGTDLFKFSRAVVRGVPNKNFPLIANLDLLPSAVQMITIEYRIHQNRFALPYSFLHKTMKPYFEGYDYVFLDCPPNLYTITRNAIFAADYCVIPYIPDFLSLSGFEILVDEVQDFYDRMSGRLTGRRRPQVFLNWESMSLSWPSSRSSPAERSIPRRTSCIPTSVLMFMWPNQAVNICRSYCTILRVSAPPIIPTWPRILRSILRKTYELFGTVSGSAPIGSDH
jgi:cellulose biosynthesis protein BcsQ